MVASLGGVVANESSFSIEKKRYIAPRNGSGARTEILIVDCTHQAKTPNK
jgi:hypothetical protein